MLPQLSEAIAPLRSELGRKAHYAANGFTAMDDRNAAEMRAVRCNSGTSATRT